MVTALVFLTITKYPKKVLELSFQFNYRWCTNSHWGDSILLLMKCKKKRRANVCDS